MQREYEARMNHCFRVRDDALLLLHTLLNSWSLRFATAPTNRSESSSSSERFGRYCHNSAPSNQTHVPWNVTNRSVSRSYEKYSQHPYTRSVQYTCFRFSWALKNCPCAFRIVTKAWPSTAFTSTSRNSSCCPARIKYKRVDICFFCAEMGARKTKIQKEKKHKRFAFF